MLDEKLHFLTGYPFIDKPWMKYYDEVVQCLEPPASSIVDYLYSCIDEYGDYTAVTYFGKKISYKALKENIELAEIVLHEIGVEQGDRVLFLMPNIPETAYLFYGCAALGGVSDFIDPRPETFNSTTNAKRLKTILEVEKPQYIIALDQCYSAIVEPLEDELSGFGVKAIIKVSAADSMNPLMRFLYWIKCAREGEKKTSAGIVEKIESYRYATLLTDSECKSSHRAFRNYPNASVNPDDIVAIVHTSGTSGSPKPIPLSHRNLNSYVLQTLHANMNIAPGDRVLHLLPYFAAFGLVGVVHAGFCHVNNLIEIPEFAPDAMPMLIANHKPQIVIGVPAWFLALPKSQHLANMDLSFLKMITYGGDSMAAKDEATVNAFLASHGCLNLLTKGHGLSEVCGCATYAIAEYNKPGSCGIPLPMTIYMLVDPETKEPVAFHDGKAVGEVAVASPSMTPGFLDGIDVANIREINGEKYLLTGDLASMDEDGIVTFLQRTDRTFTRFDGYKVVPSVIEQALESFGGMEECVISPHCRDKSFGNSIAATLIVPEIFSANPDQKIAFVEGLLEKLAESDISTSTQSFL